jgi:hypothetical protein
VATIKKRFVDKMAEIDVEKDKLRALQINFAQNRFEKSFFAGSRLGPDNRQVFTQQGRGDKAAEVGGAPTGVCCVLTFADVVNCRCTTRWWRCGLASSLTSWR